MQAGCLTSSVRGRMPWQLCSVLATGSRTKLAPPENLDPLRLQRCPASFLDQNQGTDGACRTAAAAGKLKISL
jgi:hypothetical protein